MAIRVVVNGGAGRMGGRVLAHLLEDPELLLVGVREFSGHPAQGLDAGRVAGKEDLGVRVVAHLSGVGSEIDAVVDFSLPAATIELAGEVAARKAALVTGTTGLGGEERQALMDLAREVPCVLAPNMSVGVNLLFKIAADVARTLGDGYDVEIVEAHHRFKVDAPSGTAVRLAHEIARARGVPLDENACYGREGKPGPRKPDEIGILAVRAGDIVGEHTVLFGGLGERLELVHRAHTRDNFALGALRALKWVVKQPAGLYDMMDVLGLR
ncbi:MAG: 4-hydroxy-tetrahydrodipicolinate reductase [bacterium]